MTRYDSLTHALLNLTPPPHTHTYTNRERAGPYSKQGRGGDDEKNDIRTGAAAGTRNRRLVASAAAPVRGHRGEEGGAVGFCGRGEHGGVSGGLVCGCVCERECVWMYNVHVVCVSICLSVLWCVCVYRACVSWTLYIHTHTHPHIHTLLLHRGMIANLAAKGRLPLLIYDASWCVPWLSGFFFKPWISICTHTHTRRQTRPPNRPFIYLCIYSSIYPRKYIHTRTHAHLP